MPHFFVNVFGFVDNIFLKLHTPISAMTCHEINQSRTAIISVQLRLNFTRSRVLNHLFWIFFLYRKFNLIQLSNLWIIPIIHISGRMWRIAENFITCSHALKTQTLHRKMTEFSLSSKSFPSLVFILWFRANTNIQCYSRMNMNRQT